jgi:hypothetical protein
MLAAFQFLCYRSAVCVAAITLAISSAMPASAQTSTPAPPIPQNHSGHTGHTMAKPKKATCSEPTLACAAKATPVFSANGSLVLVFATDDRVLMVRSHDLGKTFDPAVPLHPTPLQLDWGPDARPQAVFDAKGRLHVALATFKDKAFNGQVFYTRSTDDGAGFEPLTPITAVQESQRFQAMGLDPAGKLFTTWLDKRERIEVRKRGEKYTGAGLYYAWGDASKGLIGDTQAVSEGTCECCRMGLSFNTAGRPVVVYRNIFPGSARDHAVTTFDAAGKPGLVNRVSTDNWITDACPHHGPSLSVGPDDAYHVTWFTLGKDRQGLFYARSTDAGQTFSAPMPIGTAERNPSRPYVLATPTAVWLVWKEFDGGASVLMAMSSTDQGKSWSTPISVASTNDDSDHPLLIRRGDAVFVSWLTKADGYRLIELGKPS